MTERDGDVMTRVVPNTHKATFERHILENIRSGSTISTDEWIAYRSLAKRGYTYGTVDHSVDQWVDGIHHTNTVEGFWSMLKRSIRGTNFHVSRKHLSKYLGEFEFRWNLRHAPETMFARLLMSF